MRGQLHKVSNVLFARLSVLALFVQWVVVSVGAMQNSEENEESVLLKIATRDPCWYITPHSTLEARQVAVAECTKGLRLYGKLPSKLKKKCPTYHPDTVCRFTAQGDRSACMVFVTSGCLSGYQLTPFTECASAFVEQYNNPKKGKEDDSGKNSDAGPTYKHLKIQRGEDNSRKISDSQKRSGASSSYKYLVVHEGDDNVPPHAEITPRGKTKSFFKIKGTSTLPVTESRGGSSNPPRRPPPPVPEQRLTGPPQRDIHAVPKGKIAGAPLQGPQPVPDNPRFANFETNQRLQQAADDAMGNSECVIS